MVVLSVKDVQWCPIFSKESWVLGDESVTSIDYDLQDLQDLQIEILITSM